MYTKGAFIQISREGAKRIKIQLTIEALRT